MHRFEVLAVAGKDPVDHGLDCAPDQRDGRAQLVGRVGDDAAATVLEARKFRSHAVEGDSKGRNLVPSLGDDSRFEVAGCDSGSSSGERGQTRGDPPRDRDSQDQCKSGRHQCGDDEGTAEGRKEAGTDITQRGVHHRAYEDSPDAFPVRHYRDALHEVALRVEGTQEGTGGIGDHPALGIGYHDAVGQDFPEGVEGKGCHELVPRIVVEPPGQALIHHTRKTRQPGLDTLPIGMFRAPVPEDGGVGPGLGPVPFQHPAAEGTLRRGAEHRRSRGRKEGDYRDEGEGQTVSEAHRRSR